MLLKKRERKAQYLFKLIYTCNIKVCSFLTMILDNGDHSLQIRKKLGHSVIAEPALVTQWVHGEAGSKVHAFCHSLCTEIPVTSHTPFSTVSADTVPHSRWEAQGSEWYHKEVLLCKVAYEMRMTLTGWLWIWDLWQEFIHQNDIPMQSPQTGSIPLKV